MATQPKTLVKKKEPTEYETFEAALKKVLSVSHEEMAVRLKTAKTARKKVSSHASNGKR